MRSLYRRLPEGVRRCLRPLNLVDEVASFLPGRVRPGLQAGAEAVRRLVRLARTRYPLRRLVGPARGSSDRLVCLLGTDELSARYWRATLFGGPFVEEQLGDVAAASVPAVARRLARSADVSLWQTAWPISHLVRGPIVPSWLPLWLATDRPFEQLVAGDRSGRSARKNEVRRVERLGLTARVTTDAPAYEAFRRELYEPYVQQRFGDLLVALPPQVFAHARRNGWLLLTEHEGRQVAGSIIELWGGHPRILAFGVQPNSTIAPGTLLEACYHQSIRFAVERGFRRLSLGACRPVLTDGVLRYKRKWGGTLGAPTTWDAFLLRYRNTPAVRAALTHVPIVVDRGDGHLVALVGARGEAGDDLAAHLRRIEVPGLRELACLVEESVAVPSDVESRHAPPRIVPPGEVWPAGAVAG